MLWLKALPLKVWGWVILTLSLIGLIAKVYYAGGDARDVKSMKESLENAKRSKDIENDVDKLNDDDVIKRLRENGWFD